MGGIHGNEALSSQLLLMLIEHLLNQFGKDNRVTRLLNQTDVHILPMANPDGREIAEEGDCTGAGGDAQPTGRENANNVDLNLDFPGPFDRTDEMWQVCEEDGCNGTYKRDRNEKVTEFANLRLLLLLLLLF